MKVFVFQFESTVIPVLLLFLPFTEQHWKSYLPSHCDEDPEWTEALQHTSGLWLLRSLHEGSPVQLWIPRLYHTEASPLPEETVEWNNIRLRKFMPQQHILLFEQTDFLKWIRLPNDRLGFQVMLIASLILLSYSYSSTQLTSLSKNNVKHLEILLRQFWHPTQWR